MINKKISLLLALACSLHLSGCAKLGKPIELVPYNTSRNIQMVVKADGAVDPSIVSQGSSSFVSLTRVGSEMARNLATESNLYPFAIIVGNAGNTEVTFDPKEDIRIRPFTDFKIVDSIVYAGPAGVAKVREATKGNDDATGSYFLGMLYAASGNVNSAQWALSRGASLERESQATDAASREITSTIQSSVIDIVVVPPGQTKNGVFLGEIGYMPYNTGDTDDDINILEFDISVGSDRHFMLYCMINDDIQNACDVEYHVLSTNESLYENDFINRPLGLGKADPNSSGYIIYLQNGYVVTYDGNNFAADKWYVDNGRLCLENAGNEVCSLYRRIGQKIYSFDDRMANEVHQYYGVLEYLDGRAVVYDTREALSKAVSNLSKDWQDLPTAPQIQIKYQKDGVIKVSHDKYEEGAIEGIWIVQDGEVCHEFFSVDDAVDVNEMGYCITVASYNGNVFYFDTPK